MRKLIYFVIMTSFLAAQAFTVNLGLFQLSLYRGGLLMMLFSLMYKLLQGMDMRTLIPEGKNKYSVQAMIFWALYACLSIMWIGNLGAAVNNLYFIISGVFCIVMFSVYLKEESHFVTAFNLVGLMVLVHNLIGWYEVLASKYLFSKREFVSAVGGISFTSPVSTLGNPNDFALLMLFGVFIAFAALMVNKGIWLKILSSMVMVSSLLLMVITGSRANLLGIVLAVLVFILVRARNKRRILFITAVMVVVFVYLFFPGVYGSIAGRVSEALYKLLFNPEAGSDLVRTNLIKNGFYFLLVSFGFGTGVGNIENWMRANQIYNTYGIANIHNWWLEILVGYGILVFAFYLIYYGKILFDMYRVFMDQNEDKVRKYLGMAIFLGMVSFIIGGISSSKNLNKEWLWVFWALSIAFQGYRGKSVPDVDKAGELQEID